MKINCHRRARGAAIYGGVILLALCCTAPANGAGEYAAEAGMQVLTRGPVHEAFAEASMAGVTAGFTINRAPYDLIVEVPPDQRPDGADVAWIPGYWSWDEDRDDFIWVSGVWRDLPPGRQWVPGYWANVQEGYLWVSGFWGEVARTEIDYLPPPPKSLDVGPSSPAPLTPQPRATAGRGRSEKPGNAADKPAPGAKGRNPRTVTPTVNTPPPGRSAPPSTRVKTPQSNKTVGDANPRDSKPRPSASSRPENQRPDGRKDIGNPKDAPKAHASPAPNTSDRNVNV